MAKTSSVKRIAEPARTTKVCREADVVVVGGGPGGIGSAISAARSGARTVLIERYGHLGGMATGGLVNIIPHCICYGQAAGTAAALVADKGISPRKEDYGELRSNLVKQGVRLPDIK